jgi:hypothetical protein
MNPQEWKTLEEQALWLLGHGDQAPPREGLQGMVQQLRIWEYLLKGRYTSWTVILSAREYKGKRAVVREVSWDRPSDWKIRTRAVSSLKRRRDVEPSIQIRDADLNWTDLNPFLEFAGGLHFELPGMTSLLPVEDDVFGLEGFRSYAHIRMEWAGVPKSRSTIGWFRKFRKLLLDTIKDREREMDRS